MDCFGDKIIHSWYTGGQQAVGNLVSEKYDYKVLIEKNFFE